MILAVCYQIKPLKRQPEKSSVLRGGFQGSGMKAVDCHIHPLTPKSVKNQNSRKIPNFIL